MRGCRCRCKCKCANSTPCYPPNGDVCKGCQPMVDVASLLDLADKLENREMYGSPVPVVWLKMAAAKIREAVRE